MTLRGQNNLSVIFPVTGWLSLAKIVYFRSVNRHPHYRNLYFVGVSAHLDTEMPTTMVSGHLTSEQIVDDLGTYR
jgi:hypothetical protein